MARAVRAPDVESGPRAAAGRPQPPIARHRCVRVVRAGHFQLDRVGHSNVHYLESGARPAVVLFRHFQAEPGGRSTRSTFWPGQAATRVSCRLWRIGGRGCRTNGRNSHRLQIERPVLVAPRRGRVVITGCWADQRRIRAGRRGLRRSRAPALKILRPRSGRLGENDTVVPQQAIDGGCRGPTAKR